jgi:hypothetical protein
MIWDREEFGSEIELFEGGVFFCLVRKVEEKRRPGPQEVGRFELHVRMAWSQLNLGRIWVKQTPGCRMAT